ILNSELNQNANPNTTIVVGGLDGAANSNALVSITNIETSEERIVRSNSRGGFIAALTGSPFDEFQIISGGNSITIGSQVDIDVPLDTRIKLMNGAVNRNLAQLGSVPTTIEIFNDRAYVLNGFSDNIQVFDITQNPPVQAGTVTLPLGSDPVGIAFLNNTHAYVTNLISQTVSIVNIQDMSCEAIISQEDGNFAPCDEVILVEEGSFANPAGIVITNDKVYVANQNINELFVPVDNGFITVIDSDTNEIEKFIKATGEGTSGTGKGIKVIGDYIYVVNSGNVLFDFETFLFSCDTESPSSIDVIDTKKDKIDDSIEFALSEINPFVCSPESITASPDGDFAYIGSQLAGVLFKIDLDTNSLIRGADNPIIVTGVDDLDSTSDIEFNSEGYGFISMFNSDRVFAFDPKIDDVSPFPFLGEFPVGLRGDDPGSDFFDGPQLLAITDNGQNPDLFFITGISEQLGSVDTSLFIP
ncbi:MAG: hypothetical protein GWO07_07305, partial [Candidatus Dadabacteria bacterium]|nr:hypothetical protein [Candidatus Dadabacteria bacterium]NIS08556.1 hypothetical protein [Candidatus Dadabacteria bacterium]NIV41384.1 hypothetical protein [Candidatus Dadabacteria bacterium]NIX14591.1 hypothetical protein [Candidatus Dadabacteria bacterium]NIY21046.1 hypothetical protein [Candidatus Dadabacteria bacterium]